MTDHGPVHHPSIGDLFLPAANFAVYAIIVGKFVVPAVKEFFRARTERLRDGLKAGADARREAEALRAHLQRELADLPALRARMQADLRESAERERDRLVASAAQTAERIRRDAGQLADHEGGMARRALRTELVSGAVREATRLVGAAVSAEDQRRFVQEFVTASRPSA